MDLSISAPVAQENPNQFPIKPRRGLYRKRDQRAAALAMPPAWQIGNRKSFTAARARAMRGILGDLDLSGREKAALAACLDHMNAGEQWSCFASIKLIAVESGVHPSTCWKAICKADGTHILTKRASRRASSQYVSTHITIHPNHIAELRHSSEGNNIADQQKLDRNPAKTVSQSCKNHIAEMRTEPSLTNPPQITYSKEPLEIGIRDFEGKKRGKRDPWPKHGQKTGDGKRIFYHVGTFEYEAAEADFETMRGEKPRPASKYGGKGHWFSYLGEGQ